MTPPLFAASVPVFLHYLDRMEGLLDKVRGREQLLASRLVPDMFTAGQQIATAAGFALRVAYPLAGQAVPVLPDPALDRIGLGRRIAATRGALLALDPAAFDGAEARRIRHRAGFAELDQDGAAFLHLFGMPNFVFHVAMAFAILRAAGVEIGKHDFDGLHDYPPGFRL
ncbi:DUF1993 domain-containing protein [Paracoccaceae bacterium Fryx2]|nr:DUF1993 domain-containing protein [Paracoccaceae bacterium Fryx2]